MDNKLSLDRFREAMNRKGWTKRKLAEEYDEKYLSDPSNTNAPSIYKTLCKWDNENETANPTLNRLVSICDLLECDVDYLLGRMDTHTHANEFIQEQTGLSETAIEKILFFNKESTLTPILDFLLCSKEFESILTLLYELAENNFSYMTIVLKECLILYNESNAEHVTDTTPETSALEPASLRQKSSDVEKQLNKAWEYITNNICDYAFIKAIESLGLSTNIKDFENSFLEKAKSMSQANATSE